LTSRERVLTALAHREPDRVPIDLGGTLATGIAASTYHRLKKSLGISRPTRILDLEQMIAEVERPVMERLGVDVSYLDPPAVSFGIANENWKPWQLFDGTPVEVPGGFNPVQTENGELVLYRDGVPIALMPKDGFYFDLLGRKPGAAHVDLRTFAPVPMSNEDLEHLHARAEALYANTEFAIAAMLGPPEQLFAGMGWGDFAAWMITLAAEPDYVQALYEKLVSVWLEDVKRFVKAVGNRVHVIVVCDDLGTQQSPLISVKMFRNLIMPFYRRVFDWIHQQTPIRIMLHSDGAIFAMIPSLIEMGVDILNPIQTSANGMDPIRLKREFGGKLVFWGGCCDCQHTLPFGTPEEVAREAEENIRIFAPNGGYIFAPVHNIQADVPSENVKALFDTARRSR
jgi:uroporphyrinogen decarboxylase